MATVFLARAEGLGGFERDVAVKLLHAHLRENSDLALSLLNEARIAARIRHPNVVPVYDVGDDPAGIFLVMEYVEGDTLSGLSRSARAAGERIPTPIGLRILTDALAGLDSAHDQRDAAGEPLDIVHRDFSPQNILVGTDGISRLTDFGIAKAAGRLGHTSPGAIKGKVGYMAPEQARGKAVDRRCDVWAAGVVAWELLAGRPLHDGDDEVATLLDVVTQTPPDLRTIDPTIPDTLADAVTSALIVDRQQRCPTAAAFRQRLVDACPSRGALADHTQVAAFIASLGGGRALTPLPQNAAPGLADGPAGVARAGAPLPVASHEPHRTLTLQSKIVASVADALASPARATTTRWSRAWARPLLAAGALGVAIAAGAALFHRLPPQPRPELPSAARTADAPTTAISASASAAGEVPMLTAAVVAPGEAIAVALTHPPIDPTLSNTVARPGRTDARAHAGGARATHGNHRTHVRVAHHPKTLASAASPAPHATTLGLSEPAARAPHAPPPLAGNPYAGVHP